MDAGWRLGSLPNGRTSTQQPFVSLVYILLQKDPIYSVIKSCYCIQHRVIDSLWRLSTLTEKALLFVALPSGNNAFFYCGP